MADTQGDRKNRPNPDDPAGLSDLAQVWDAMPAATMGDQPEPQVRDVSAPRAGRPPVQPYEQPGDPLGTESRPPLSQVRYTMRRWPESPPLTGEHVRIGEPVPVGRGDQEPTELAPQRPMRREPPDSWDAPLFR